MTMFIIIFLGAVIITLWVLFSGNKEDKAYREKLANQKKLKEDHNNLTPMIENKNSNSFATRQTMLNELDDRIQQQIDKMEQQKKAIENKFLKDDPAPLEFKFNGLPHDFIEEEYTAFDFETADDNPESVIKLSIAHFRGINLIKIKEYLFSPLVKVDIRDNQYKYTYLHGIHPSHTKDMPTIVDIWDEIEKELNGKHLVAHNKDFDIEILRNVATYTKRPLLKCKITCTHYYSRLSINWMHTFKLETVCKDQHIPYWGIPSKFKSVSTGILFIYLSTIISNNSYNRFMTGVKLTVPSKIKPDKKQL